MLTQNFLAAAQNFSQLHPYFLINRKRKKRPFQSGITQSFLFENHNSSKISKENCLTSMVFANKWYQILKNSSNIYKARYYVRLYCYNYYYFIIAPRNIFVSKLSLQ